MGFKLIAVYLKYFVTIMNYFMLGLANPKNMSILGRGKNQSISLEKLSSQKGSQGEKN